MSDKITKICVIGAGIMGLSTALNVLETLSKSFSEKISLVIIADKFSPNTTSDIAAGFFMLNSNDNNPKDLLSQWGKDTIDHFIRIANSSDATDAGVSLLSGYTLCKSDNKTTPYYADILLGFRPMCERELVQYGVDNLTHGWAYVTASCNCGMYLPWLHKRFEEKGGRFIQRKVANLEELYQDYDIIVNCCGLGNYALLNDTEMRPIRGQVIRVDAPWVKIGILGNSCYILPSFDHVVLGGTHQYDNWNLEIDEEDKNAIWEKCCRLMPSLKNARIIRHEVGLRPARNIVRLESEVIQRSGDKGSKTIIHNYGHSGSGVSLHWGCALEAARLVKEAFLSIKS